MITKLVYLCRKSGQFVKDFSATESVFFLFFTMAANDRGYGLGRAAGEFPIAIATKEMRAQRLPEAQ